MKVSEVMTTDVVTATPATTYKDAVDLMLAHDVGALPVLDELGRVIGIVSEADLVAKPGWVARERRPLAALLDALVAGAPRAKAHARTVGDVMTGSPVVLRAADSVAAAARVLVRGRLKHAPVVDTSRLLVGIISRQDLLGAYARPDELVASDVTELLADPLRTPPGEVAAAVRDGVVTLTGRVETQNERDAVLSATWRVPGVVDVIDLVETERPVVVV